MLTQDDFVAPKMSAEGSLQRSSWKAEAIRRGHLKISGPFPITEETPLNDDEEREYAANAQVDTPLQSAGISQPCMPPPPLALPAVETAVPETVVDDTGMPPVSDVPLDCQDHHILKHKVSSASLREKSVMQATSSPPTATYSSASPFPAIPRSSTIADSKKKRKGSLRNVFRKMFGKKAKESTEEDAVSRHSHHRSEPITLLESPKVTREKSTGARISDLHVRELEPINPLGQHLPFPMNVNAPQEMSPPHDYLTFNVQRSELNRRRATLPSVLQAATEAQSSDAQDDLAQSPQIGIALSSPPPNAQSVQSKRRSRSAGALRDLAKPRPSIERRRSAEIRYWRGSYQSGSIYSTATPRPQTARTVEKVGIGLVEPAAIVPELDDDPKPIDRFDALRSHQDVTHATPPVDAFDFGNLKSHFVEVEPDDAAVVIVSSHSEKRLSIEDRVKYLEHNMQALETSVRRISGRSNRHTIILENAPRGLRSRNGSSSAVSESQGSRYSSTSSRRTLGAQQEGSRPGSPTLAAAPTAEDTFQSSSDHHQTDNDFDLNLFPPPSSGQMPDVAQQLAIISEALGNERSARRELELQVDRLQREVTDLHVIVNKFVSRSPSYPTPSPDTIITSNEERLSTPRAASHALRGLGLEGEDDAPDTLRRIRETVISRFSQSDSELEHEQYSVTSSRDDITSPEAWATPKEESGFGSGFFSGNRSKEAV